MKKPPCDTDHYYNKFYDYVDNQEWDYLPATFYSELHDRVEEYWYDHYDGDDQKTREAVNILENGKYSDDTWTTILTAIGMDWMDGYAYEYAQNECENEYADRVDEAYERMRDDY